MDLAPADKRPSMTITPAVLLAASYRQYDQHDMDRYKRHLYQKRVRNEASETLYFVGFTYWTFPDRDAMSVSGILYRDSGETMDLRLAVEGWGSVEYVEKFYAHAHAALACGKDRQNQ